MNKKDLVLCVLLSIISITVNFIPIVYSPKLNFITVLNIIFLYIISRKSPSMGLISYIIVFLFTSLFSYKISIVFLFLNGLLGLFTGMFRSNNKSGIFITTIMTVILTISINGMNLVLNFLGYNIYLNQSIIIVFSITYSAIFLLISDFIYNKTTNTKHIK